MNRAFESKAKETILILILHCKELVLWEGDLDC